jgi:hypothetical protein
MELGEFFETAHAVVSMREVLAGNRDPRVIAVRHDVDNHREALATAVELARWEAENGWRSTYFLLHTAQYWTDGRWRQTAETIALLGHEIGLHVNAVAYALQHGGDPNEIVFEALEELRDAGHVVTGIVGHGSQPICTQAEFANDEQFVECARPKMGEPDRELSYGGRTLRLDPRPLADFGLQYEAIGLRQYELNGIKKTREGQVYNTDSGCKWHYPFSETIAEFNAITDGQLHLLIHSDHWHQAFDKITQCNPAPVGVASR